jgi:hypothetical protein
MIVQDTVLFSIRTPKPTLGNDLIDNQNKILDYVSEVFKELEIAINDLEKNLQEVQ